MIVEEGVFKMYRFLNRTIIIIELEIIEGKMKRMVKMRHLIIQVLMMTMMMKVKKAMKIKFL
jgi:hypothetical protein